MGCAKSFGFFCGTKKKKTKIFYFTRCGSHPHLVHAFIDALVTGTSPYPNAKQSANITCVGILAHESALKGGKIMKLPEFTYS